MNRQSSIVTNGDSFTFLFSFIYFIFYYYLFLFFFAIPYIHKLRIRILMGFVCLFQGFFIFVMHVLRSSEVRAAYLRKKEKWNTTKNSNFPSSRSAIDASADFSEKHAMRPIRGCTESTDPLSRRHQVSPMNSDIMNTRESCLTPVDS